MKNRQSQFIFLLFSIALAFSGCGPSSEELKISAIQHFSRGNSYYQENKLKLAAKEYKMAIADDPEQEGFYYNLGLVYHSLVLYDKAVEQYEKAIALNPKFADAWYNLALALEKNDHTEKAYLAYKKYQTLNQEQKKISEQKAAEKPKPVVVSKPKSNTKQ